MLWGLVGLFWVCGWNRGFCLFCWCLLLSRGVGSVVLACVGVSSGRVLCCPRVCVFYGVVVCFLVCLFFWWFFLGFFRLVWCSVCCTFVCVVCGVVWLVAVFFWCFFFCLFRLFDLVWFLVGCDSGSVSVVGVFLLCFWVSARFWFLSVLRFSFCGWLCAIYFAAVFF